MTSMSGSLNDGWTGGYEYDEVEVGEDVFDEDFFFAMGRSCNTGQFTHMLDCLESMLATLQ